MSDEKLSPIVQNVAVQLALADGFNPHDRVVPVDTAAAHRFPNGRRALYRPDDLMQDFTVYLWELYTADAERMIKAGFVPAIVASALQRAADNE